MASHTSPQSVVYSGLGHDVAGRKVTDVTVFLARQAGGGRHLGQQRRHAASIIHDDHMERSASIHWPDGYDPGHADLFADNTIVIDAPARTIRAKLTAATT